MPSKPKKGKTNPAIVVALIGLAGTLITALFTSPVLIELIKRSGVTATAEATMTSTPSTSWTPSSATKAFEENFEDEMLSGFGIHSGEWEIVKEKSNRALKLTAAGSKIPAAVAEFGPSEFADGIIEFKVMFVEMEGLYLDFREQADGSKYSLALSPSDSTITWGFNIFDGSDWKFSPIRSATNRTFAFQQDVWYLVRLEASGTQIAVVIDTNRTISDSDDRFSSGSLHFVLQPGAVILLDDVRIWIFD